MFSIGKLKLICFTIILLLGVFTANIVSSLESVRMIFSIFDKQSCLTYHPDGRFEKILLVSLVITAILIDIVYF